MSNTMKNARRCRRCRRSHVAHATHSSAASKENATRRGACRSGHDCALQAPAHMRGTIRHRYQCKRWTLVDAGTCAEMELARNEPTGPARMRLARSAGPRNSQPKAPCALDPRLCRHGASGAQAYDDPRIGSLPCQTETAGFALARQSGRRDINPQAFQDLQGRSWSVVEWVEIHCRELTLGDGGRPLCAAARAVRKNSPLSFTVSASASWRNATGIVTIWARLKKSCVTGQSPPVFFRTSGLVHLTASF